MGTAVLRSTIFFFSSRRRHTRLVSDWSSDVCSSDLFCQNACMRVSRGSSVWQTEFPDQLGFGKARSTSGSKTGQNAVCKPLPFLDRGVQDLQGVENRLRWLHLPLWRGRSLRQEKLRCVRTRPAAIGSRRRR